MNEPTNIPGGWDFPEWKWTEIVIFKLSNSTIMNHHSWKIAVLISRFFLGELPSWTTIYRVWSIKTWSFGPVFLRTISVWIWPFTFVNFIIRYSNPKKGSKFGNILYTKMAVCQNLVPLVNIKIAGKWMFIPLKMVLIGVDPYPNSFSNTLLYCFIFQRGTPLNPNSSVIPWGKITQEMENSPW